MIPMKPRAIVLAAAAVLAAGAVGATSAVAGADPAGTAAVAPSSPNGARPTFLTQAQALANGDLSMSSTTTASGAEQLTYHMGSNTYESIIPPASFNPLTATDTELEANGLPPRPTTPAGLASWTTAMQDRKSTPVPNLQLITGSPEAPGPQSTSGSGSGSTSTQPAAATTSPSAGTYPGSYWGGWAATSTNDLTWTGAEDTFSAPTIYADCNPSYMAIWTGMGGYLPGPFTDEGGGLTQSGIYWNGSWFPFWETLSEGDTGVQELYGANNTAVPVNTGNELFSSTSWSDGNGGSTQFYLENETTGQVADTIHINQNDYNGSSADFITEFPGAYGADFSPFATINVAAQATGVGWLNLDQASTEQFTVTNGMNTSGLSDNGTAFSNAFVGCA